MVCKHEYMNIAPPPPINDVGYAPAWQGVARRKKSSKTMIGLEGIKLQRYISLGKQIPISPHDRGMKTLKGIKMFSIITTS